jgi:prephenate dehydrogenase
MGFEKVFIIGFGQIGKSIANTLKVNCFDGRVFVSSRTKVDGKSFIDGWFDLQTLNKNDFNNSVIFVCTPPDVVAKVLKEVFKKIKNVSNCVVSDVCSVKKGILRFKNKNFVSIHPMDGGSSQVEKNFFFKKNILNYIIDNSNVGKGLLFRYNGFLTSFLNCINVKVSGKKHDEIVALISHLQVLILATYYDDFSKIDNQMWREVFVKNKKNIFYFLQKFFKNMKQNIKNNSLERSIVLSVKNIINEEEIKIKKDLFNPSLRNVLKIKENPNRITKKTIDYQKNFLKNMKSFFKNLVGEEVEI